MKIIVVKENGEQEIISFKGPALFRKGKNLNKLVTRNYDYYFTLDGYYDGWGKRMHTKILDIIRLKEI